MTDEIKKLIDEAYAWREPYSVGSLIRRLADSLEAEHRKNVEGPCHHQNTAHLRIMRENDALRTAIQELHAGLGRFDPVAFHAEATEILSRAVIKEARR